MRRCKVNDSMVENLDGGNVFCRNRQGGIKAGSGCRTDLARVEMCSDLVQARLVCDNMILLLMITKSVLCTIFGVLWCLRTLV